MSIKKIKETFKQMLELCYEEDFQELHKELVSLTQVVKSGKKEEYDYIKAMEEIFTIINLYSEDFPTEIIEQLEEMYLECVE